MRPLISLLTIVFATIPLQAKVPEGFNEDEAKVLPYDLPNVLTDMAGKTVSSAQEWQNHRRREIINLLEREMFGKSPALPAKANIKASVTSPAATAVGGLAIRQQITVQWSEAEGSPSMDILIYLPRNASGPVPLFWGLNFEGNHSVEEDAAIPLSRSLLADELRKPRKRPVAESRGSQKTRYPLEIPIKAGYAVATCCYADIDPDFDDQFKNGVHGLYAEPRNSESWGSLAAWAWGMRVGLEYFSTQKDFLPKGIIAMGHSRLGKAALWAGATDERFAAIISNNSGCGGAALSKRNFGETVSRINTAFPHWFCENYRKYNDNEAAMPWDQHFLIATAAPRPILITSATEDAWADPRGEFLSGVHAGPVYKLFSKEGLGTTNFPEPDKYTGDRVAYFLRTGVHDVTASDWAAYVRFADTHIKPKR